VTPRRFTVAGSAIIEQRLELLLKMVGERLAVALPPHDCRAVVLIGGYGRGEGGVVRVDGEERPHNNLDLLLIAEAKAHGRQSQLKAAAEMAVAPLAVEAGIGIDIGTTSTRALAWSSCLVMWYDMRFGHRTVLGDADYVPGLKRFTVERIDRRDIRALIVNRGTLVIINRLIAATGDSRHRQAMIRHVMKAIIGYGDALLFVRGKYHWSYVEKRARMATCMEVSADFRSLYDRAAGFRFEPNYAEWDDVDIAAWTSALVPLLGEAHRQVEAYLLKGLRGWDVYGERLCQAAAMAGLSDLRMGLAALRNMVRSRACPLPMGWKARFGWRCLSASGRLAAAFPGVLYDDAGHAAKAASAAILSVSDSADLTNAYLRQWGRDGDVNLHAALQRFGVVLHGAS